MQFKKQNKNAAMLLLEDCINLTCMVPQTSAPVVITERGQRLVHVTLFKVACPNSPHTSCRTSFGKAVAALQSGRADATVYVGHFYSASLSDVFSRCPTF